MDNDLTDGGNRSDSGDSLRLGELEKDSKVEIVARKKGCASIYFTADVELAKDDSCYIRPIMHDGKYVNFDSVEVDLQATVGSNHYAFKLDEFKLVKVKELIYHMAVSSMAAVPCNRRGATRVKCTSSVVALLRTNRVAQSGMLKDVSSSGLAFVTQGDKQVVPESEILVTFQPSFRRYTYKVSGSVVRCVYHNEDNLTEIALHFHKEYPEVNELVTYLQRQEMLRLKDKGRV